MKKEKIELLVEQYGDDMLKMDGYDDCIIGVVERCGQPTIFCYSTEKVLKRLMKEDGLTLEEAEEWFTYNQLGAWVGAKTPCFLTK